eukprot:3947796-Prymnesium_polylepis.1
MLRSVRRAAHARVVPPVVPRVVPRVVVCACEPGRMTTSPTRCCRTCRASRWRRTPSPRRARRAPTAST